MAPLQFFLLLSLPDAKKIATKKSKAIFYENVHSASRKVQNELEMLTTLKMEIHDKATVIRYYNQKRMEL